MTDRQNTLTINHLGEDVVHGIAEVKLEVNDGQLNLEAKAIRNESGPFSHLSSPALYIEDATVSASSKSAIASEEIVVDDGWDTDEIEKEDNIFRICINQHLALNNNRVTLRRVDDQIEVDWTCTCQNVLDFRDADNELRLHCSIPIE